MKRQTITKIARIFYCSTPTITYENDMDKLTVGITCSSGFFPTTWDSGLLKWQYIVILSKTLPVPRLEKFVTLTNLTSSL
jgi:hypothetical protein